MSNILLKKKEQIISLIMPTRERPKEALAFLTSAFLNCNKPHKIEVVIYIDDDDSSYKNFNSPFLNTHFLTGKRQPMSLYNKICGENSKGDILCFVNDDIIIETPHWDARLREIDLLFKDSIYLCYPNDCFKGKSLSVFPIITRTVFKNFNMFPSIFKGSFIDSHIHETFRFLKGLGHNRIVYRDDIIFRHNHFRVTGTPPDATYKNRDRFGDDKSFFKSVFSRDQIAKEMRDFIEKKISLPDNKSEVVLISNFNAFKLYLFHAQSSLTYRLITCSKMLLRYIYMLIIKYKSS